MNESAKTDKEFLSGISEISSMLEKLASGDPHVRVSIKTKDPSLKKVDSLLNEVAESFEDMVGLSNELAIGISEHYDALSKIADGDRSIRAREDSKNELISKLGVLINQESQALTHRLVESENASLELAIGLSEIFEVLRAVSSGNLDARVIAGSDNELLAKLGVVVNRMILSIKDILTALKELAAKEARSAEAAKKRAEELSHAYEELKQAQAQLLQSEKLAAIGRLGSGVAHELNSPLTGLLSLLRAYHKETKEGTREYEDFADMIEAAQHMAKVISDLNAFARVSKGEPAEISLQDVVESTLSFSAYPFMQKKIKITKDYAADLLKIRADKSRLQQVVLNLITNAYDAMCDGGELTIRLRNSEKADKVIAEFIDTGTGIKEENLQKIFDPFFTTKVPGKGTGLGLSISHGIIQSYQGEISVENIYGKGAKFIVALPSVGK